MATTDSLRHQKINSLMAQHTDNVAAVALDLWQPMATKIISIIGEAGFNSLYARSLFLSQATFPWLDAASSSPQTETHFVTLKQCFEAQAPAQVCAANSLLLITFTDILASLIGEPLTSNILRSAWGAEALTVPQHDVSHQANDVNHVSRHHKEFKNE
jgi:hypothetical protein